MALSQRPRKIPYNVILLYADRNEDLQNKLENASKLQTAEEVLNYARTLTHKNGDIDEYAQFLIVATHKETSKKYPYLQEYLVTEGDDKFGHDSWSAVRRGMEHERHFNCLTVGPLAVVLLSAMTLFFTSQVGASTTKLYHGAEPFESSCKLIGNAFLGGLAFFGAKTCKRLIDKDCNELATVGNLHETLKLRR